MNAAFGRRWAARLPVVAAGYAQPVPRDRPARRAAVPAGASIAIGREALRTAPLPRPLAPAPGRAR